MRIKISLFVIGLLFVGLLPVYGYVFTDEGEVVYFEEIAVETKENVLDSINQNAEIPAFARMTEKVQDDSKLGRSEQSEGSFDTEQNDGIAVSNPSGFQPSPLIKGENFNYDIGQMELAEIPPDATDILTPPLTFDDANVYRAFTGEEFKEFQNVFDYPNTKNREVIPYIRGHQAADNRIRMLAENRGYVMRPEGWGLQSETNSWYYALRNEGLGHGVDIRVTSTYRSVGDQRWIFNSRLNYYGYTNEEIAAGYADIAINTVLKKASIPGYSKHHTGYAVDLNCSGGRLSEFKDSNCYTWLSANNFYNAKRFGFIPSYPEGVNNQGPDPESWEFVWVGADNLKNRQVEGMVLF